MTAWWSFLFFAGGFIAGWLLHSQWLRRGERQAGPNLITQAMAAAQRKQKKHKRDI